MSPRRAARLGLALALAAFAALAASPPLAQDAPPAAADGTPIPPPTTLLPPDVGPEAPVRRPAVRRPPAIAPATSSPATPGQPAAAPAPVPQAVSPAATTSPAALPPPPAPTARLAPGEAIPPDQLEALVDGAVQEAMAAGHVPGVTVSVVQNGQVVLKKGYGLASLSPARPVDPDKTLFRVGSISKLFTSIAVMKEVERGHMRLDGPVNQYLPETLQVKDQGFSRPVLLRDLLNHSAGFEDRMFGRLFERDPGRVRPLARYLRQEAPRRVEAQGVRPEYSNYGAALAGEAASQVAGKPYEDLVEAEIIRPLGMSSTTFREPYSADGDLPAPMPAALAANLSQGFAWTGAGYEPQPFEYISQVAPAGAASSTAADMARLMTLILGGGTLDGQTVYGSASAQAFRTVFMRAGADVDGWAMGFQEQRLPGGFDSFGHQGQTLNFASNLVTVPALNLGIFVSGNSAGAIPLAERLPKVIVARFYALAEPAAAPSGDLVAQARAYGGTYLSEKRRYGGLEQFVDQLTRAVSIKVTPAGLLAVRGGDGAQAFTPTDQPGRFQALDGPGAAAFEIAGGVARRFAPPSGMETYVRIGPLKQVRTLAILTLLVLVAAAAALGGLAIRDRRDRQTPVQSQAGALQAATAVLWLISMGCFAAWALPALRDPSVAFYDWPGPFVLIASSCALVAALCSLAQTLVLPAIWRGGRRVESWTGGRKLRFSMTALIFLAFAVLLGMWGALEPWSG